MSEKRYVQVVDNVESRTNIAEGFAATAARYGFVVESFGGNPNGFKIYDPYAPEGVREEVWVFWSQGRTTTYKYGTGVMANGMKKVPHKDARNQLMGMYETARYRRQRTEQNND